MSQTTLRVCLQNGGRMPNPATSKSAGYDLYAPMPGIVPAGGDLLVKTGVSIALPEGYYAQIWPRSGMDLKYRVSTGAGVIDEDYRGEIGVLLRNFGNSDYIFNAGDRIAQMVIMKYEKPICINVANLDETNRGAGGFGSTGTQ